ncbi:MAG: HIT domain-containing protein [bacterium]|nr:HIT domain-containing protein [bacterium]
MPKKHIEFFFDLTTEEFIRWFNLLQKVKTVIQKKYNPDGFNIGINEGEAA